MVVGTPVAAQAKLARKVWVVVGPGETRWGGSTTERAASTVTGGVAKKLYGCGAPRVFHRAGDIVGMRPDTAGV